MARRTTISAAAVVLAFAAMALLGSLPAFVSAPGAAAVSERSLRGEVAERLPAMASAAALALAADPVFASDYDDRQGEATTVLIGTIVAAVVITAGFVLVLYNVYK